MNKNNFQQKGFTLIELLVVVAIIGLLSSVVLASLSTARLKSRDVAIQEETNQFKILMEQEYTETGSYANLQRGWGNLTDCAANGFAGNFAADAVRLCNAIMKNSAASPYGDTIRFHSGTAIDNNKYYALMVYLPAKQTWLCVGSSGAMSDILGSDGHTNYWQEPGCYNNP